MTEQLSITSETPDFDLTQAAASGNMAAFEEIHKRHNRLVYTICLRILDNAIEAEDQTQDVFIDLYRKIGSFRGDSAFTTWLHRKTVNQVLVYFGERNLKAEDDPRYENYLKEVKEDSDPEPTAL